MTAFTDPASLILSKIGMKQYAGPMQTLYTSPINTPVYSDLTVVAGTYTVDKKQVSYDTIHLPDALFVVSKKKQIKAMGISGGTSDVLEYGGSQSAEISCTVRIYGYNLNYPKDLVKNFYLMLQSNQPVKINSWYLNQFDIRYAIITNYSPIIPFMVVGKNNFYICGLKPQNYEKQTLANIITSSNRNNNNTCYALYY